MDKLMDFILCEGITLFELIAIIAIMLLTQRIVYKASRKRINLFKIITTSILRFNDYLTEKYN